MWAVTSSFIAAGCVLSAVSSSCPNHQSGNPPFPIMVLCPSARAPRYPQQGWSPASSSRNGVYWKAIEQLCFFREGRMMSSQEPSPQIQVLESGFSACYHPAPCHGPHLQFHRTGVLILLERETATVGPWSPFCDESDGHPTHKSYSFCLLACVPWTRQFK